MKKKNPYHKLKIYSAIISSTSLEKIKANFMNDKFVFDLFYGTIVDWYFMFDILLFNSLSNKLIKS